MLRKNLLFPHPFFRKAALYYSSAQPLVAAQGRTRLMQKHTSKKFSGNSPAKTLNISRLEARDGNEKLQCFSISSSPIQTRIFSSAHCMNVRSVIE